MRIAHMQGKQLNLREVWFKNMQSSHTHTRIILQSVKQIVWSTFALKRMLSHKFERVCFFMLIFFHSSQIICLKSIYWSKYKNKNGQLNIAFTTAFYTLSNNWIDWYRLNRCECFSSDANESDRDLGGICF